jgi:hypothetical protein
MNISSVLTRNISIRANSFAVTSLKNIVATSHMHHVKSYFLEQRRMARRRRGRRSRLSRRRRRSNLRLRIPSSRASSLWVTLS